MPTAALSAGEAVRVKEGMDIYILLWNNAT